MFPFPQVCLFRITFKLAAKAHSEKDKFSPTIHGFPQSPHLSPILKSWHILTLLSASKVCNSFDPHFQPDDVS